MNSCFRSHKGRSLRVRPLAESDGVALLAMLTSLSAQTVYARYLMAMPHLSPEVAAGEVRRLFALQRSGGLVLIAADEASGAVIAVAELARDQATLGRAEAALLVTDAYQREGVGRAVSAHLVAAAPRHGISSVAAHARFDNRAIQRLVTTLGRPYSAETTGGMTRYLFSA